MAWKPRPEWLRYPFCLLRNPMASLHPPPANTPDPLCALPRAERPQEALVSGWWILPALALSLGMMTAAIVFLGVLVTFGGMLVLTGATALLASHLSRKAACESP